jgi:penicillin-binding protein 1B
LQRYGMETAQVLDPSSVYLLEYAMQGTFERGTARAMKDSLSSHLPLAGKTGTTNDLRDSWFAGYGDDLVGVVWLGHDDNRETGLTGASGALRVWTDIMRALDIQPRQSFPPPELEMHSVALQAVRDPSSRDCRLTQTLPFDPDQRPSTAVSCETAGSLIDRVIERINNRR